MERIPVASSDLKSVGYDKQQKTLEIEFVSGGIYLYFYITEKVYLGLMNASSHGQYFNKYIRNSYPYKQIT